MEEPSFYLWSYLHLLGRAEQPWGSVPTFPSTVLGDCIFGIKSELNMHPQEMWSLVMAHLRPCCAPWSHCQQV